MNVMETTTQTNTIQLKSPRAERRILYSLAHPDDESFGYGASIAYYARNQVDVHLICATRGEVGTVDEHFMEKHDTIADLRTSELLCAANPLGLTAIHFLNYRDSGMPGSEDNHHPKALHAADQNEVAARVATVIRQIKPQIVVTFDPIGGYYHPDHIAIHKATAQAYEMAGDPAFDDGNPPFSPSRLFYTIIPRGLFRFGVRFVQLFGANPRKFGRNKDIDLVSLAEVDFPVHCKVNVAAYRKFKTEASDCHASQQSGFQRGPIAWAFWWLGRYERFMQAQPPVTNSHVGKDLWEGV